MRRVLACVVLLTAAMAAGCSSGDSASEAACEKLEELHGALGEWRSELEDVDLTTLDGLDDALERSEAARSNAESLQREVEEKAPSKVSNALAKLDELDPDSVRIADQEAIEAHLETVNTWIRQECGLAITW